MAILPRSKWSWLLLRIALQDASSEVTNICPPLMTRVFVDGTTALMSRKNKVVPEMAKKLIKMLKERGREERAQIVSDRRWDGRKEQDDCVVWLPGG